MLHRNSMELRKNGDLLLVVPMIKIFQVWKLFWSIPNSNQIHLHELKSYKLKLETIA